MLAIEIKDLTKIYGKKSSGKSSSPDSLGEGKLALDSLNLEIPKGSVFGLLGPNGAGKSTLINILAGTVMKTSGTAKIMGFDITETPKAARSQIGVVPQEIVVDSFFPLYQSLELYAGYHGIRKKDRKTDEILKSLSLYDKRKNKPTQLSGGMKRRFLIAKSMVHDPDVIILDEPTAGVDIELRNQLWDHVRELNKAGKTIIITTHYLAEAQELCDHIAFINHGQIVKHDSKENLLQNLGSRFIDVEFERLVEPSLLSSSKLKYEITGDQKVRFHVNLENYNFGEILDLIRSTKLEIKDLNITQPDLEDIFLKIVKQ